MDEKLKHKIHHILAAIIFIAGVLGIVYSVRAYPQVFRVDVQLESDRDITPREALQLNFSEPMIVERTSSVVTISPKEEVNFHWLNGNKSLVITPFDSWKPEQEYNITISGGISIMLTEINERLTFRTVAYPRVSEFYPKMGERDVIFDIEDPMTAVFSKSIEDFRVKVVINPAENLVNQLDLEKKKVDFLSKNGFQRGQRYDVEIMVRHKDESESRYQKIYTTWFETKPFPPATWEKDLNLRLEQARRFSDPKIKEGKYIDLNVESQVMTIFENGKLVDAFLISSGKRGMGTPQGTFHISNKFPRAWSKKYGLFMPYWMALVPSGDFGIHELPEWPGGFKEGAAHLGTPVSHGCVRLGVGPAQFVYNWAEIGTPVVVHN
ncbi:MAG: L,D-transpeptidase family protein [Candidatus Moranbacteria bacterium]|nr:L,D-transpeptidase family protein [Candidatus Moranbacteria bacterium]